MEIRNGQLVRVYESDINPDGSFTFPEGITSIGESAFKGCKNLTKISIPKGVTSIGNRAFENCVKLGKISIPKGVTSIGDGAFEYCEKLGEINIPEGVKHIGYWTFFGCTDLTKVNMPNSITSIEKSAFAYCFSLTEIRIPEGVTGIGSEAFYSCRKLTSIEIPKSVTRIGSKAFYDCEKLTSIRIPESVTRIGNGAFWGCSGLTEIRMPENITQINGGTFCDCSSLKKIRIPESVTRIGAGAFCGCHSLTAIRIPEKVTKIERDAFRYCSSLKKIRIPESVTRIGAGAFMGCHSLTVIRIPEKVTKIERDTFRYCSNLVKTNIPKSVTWIGQCAFDRTKISQSIKSILGILKISPSELKNHRFLNSIASDTVKKAVEYDIGQIYMEFEDMGYYMEMPLINYIKNNAPTSREELENLKQMISIIEKSQLKHSKDYRHELMHELMEKFAINMYKTIGLDEMRELLDIQKLSKNEIVRYFSEADKRYKECFNRHCEIQGEMGIAIQVFNGLEKSQIFTPKDRFEFYKQLNAMIQNPSSREQLRSLENIVESIKPGAGQKVRDLSQRLNEKVIKKNISASEIELRRSFNSTFAGLPRQGEFVYNKVRDLMIKGYRESGKIDLERMIPQLEEAFGGENNNVGPVISAKKEEIISNFLEYFEAHKIEINRSMLDVIKFVGDEIGKGYIRKILMVQSPRMTREELEEWIARVNNPKFTREKLTYDEVLEVKSGKEEEVYRILDEQNGNVQGIVTYNQIEAMFGGMKEPYSQDFIKYWKKHKREILSNPKYFSRLSQIHNTYDTILEDPKNTKVEEWSVETLLKKIEMIPFEHQRPGDEELADIALSAVPKGFNPENFQRAQKIFDRMRKREETSIPPVTTEIHGKYRGRILRPDDPLAIFVGTLTDCCQELDNAGEACMIHSAINKHGGVFVVEEVDESGKALRLVAQSWAWRNKGRLCFDNIEQEKKHFETTVNGMESREVLEVYREAAKKALEVDDDFFDTLEREGKITPEQRKMYQLREVTIGEGYNNQEAFERLIESGKLRRAKDMDPEGFHGYRDSNTSYVIAENTKVGKADSIDEKDILPEPSSWYRQKREENDKNDKEHKRDDGGKDDFDEAEFYDGDDYDDEDDYDDREYHDDEDSYDIDDDGEPYDYGDEDLDDEIDNDGNYYDDDIDPYDKYYNECDKLKYKYKRRNHSDKENDDGGRRNNSNEKCKHNKKRKNSNRYNDGKDAR